MKIRIKKDDIMLISLFIVSFFNRWLIIMFLIYLCYRAFQNIEYGVEGLLLITFRTIIGTSIAVDIGSVQMFKWLSIFGISFIVFMNCRKKIPYKYEDLLILAFVGYVSLISFVNSSFPIVSIFKCISYGFVFWAVFRGIKSTKDHINWLDKLYKYMTLLFIGCFISMPFSFAYYSSASWFAGITNQSNMFGILAGLYVGILLTKMLEKGCNLQKWFMLFITFAMAWKSNSRTGMLSVVISIVIFLFIKIIKDKKYTYLIVSGIVIAFVYFWGYGDDVINQINVFVYKGSTLNNIDQLSTQDIFSSREGQLDTFLTKFNNNPMIGSGFSVPFVKETVCWNFSFNLLVEPGNIFYAVLGDLGIIGFLLWISLYGFIFIKNFEIKKVLIFLAPFTICLGEMVFFSTNNIAIILYTMISIYGSCTIKESMKGSKI